MNGDDLVNWMNMNPELVFLGFIAFGAFFFYWDYATKNKRKKEVKALGKSLGLKYSFKPTVDIFKLCSDFKMFQQKDYWKEANNTLSGVMNDVSCLFFDYSFHTQATSSSSGANSPVELVVCFAKFKNMTLPSFSMRAEHFFDSWGEKLGMQKDIDFFESPEFSKRYLLKGDDPEKIKALFNYKLIRFLETREESIAIKAVDNKLLLYESRELYSVKKTTDFIQSVIKIITFLKAEKTILE